MPDNPPMENAAEETEPEARTTGNHLASEWEQHGCQMPDDDARVFPVAEATLGASCQPRVCNPYMCCICIWQAVYLQLCVCVFWVYLCVLYVQKLHYQRDAAAASGFGPLSSSPVLAGRGFRNINGCAPALFAPRLALFVRRSSMPESQKPAPRIRISVSVSVARICVSGQFTNTCEYNS